MFKSLTQFMSNLLGKKVETKTQVRGWTKEQEKELVSLFKARVPKKRISVLTGRSVNSINYKLGQMFDSCSVKKVQKKLARVK